MATRYKFTITDLSFDSLVESCRNLAASYFPSWQFDNPNDLGRFALDLYLHAVDSALWVINAWVNEFNIITARERRNVESRAKALGYPVKGLVAATGNASLIFTALGSLRNVDKFAIQLSADGEDGNKVYCENSAAFTIPSNITTVTVDMVEGKSYQQSATGTGKPFQEILIREQSVITGSVGVTVDGVEWDEVESFASALAADTVFMVEWVGERFARIVFGDGVNGAVAGTSLAIVISGRIGGGTRGHLLSDTIKKVEVTPYPISSVNANSELSGGQDIEDIDRIRVNGPVHRRMYDRLGQIRDVKLYVESLGGVARGKAYLIGKMIYLRIVPNGGGIPSQQLLTNVRTAVLDKIIMGYSITVAAPAYKTATIAVHGTARSGLLVSEVQLSIQTTILNRLNTLAKDENGVYLNDFGRYVQLDDLIYAIRQDDSFKPGFVVTAPVSAIVMNPDEIITDVGSTVTVTIDGGNVYSKIVEFKDVEE
jgi:hypothetical protein